MSSSVLLLLILLYIISCIVVTNECVRTHSHGRIVCFIVEPLNLEEFNVKKGQILRINYSAI